MKAQNKFTYKKLLDCLARSNFVWINYNKETSYDLTSGVQRLEIALNIPN